MAPTLWLMRSCGISRRPAKCASLYVHTTKRLHRLYGHRSAPDFAFAFDIDGVLLHTQKPIRRAAEALTLLQSEKIPFILLTNGGGKHESDRVAELSRHLGVPLDTSNFLQSHTPFAQFVHGHQTSGSDALRDKCVLVVGGESDNCRKVAEKYGFTNVVTPGDIYAAFPTIWPFSDVFKPYHEQYARPIPVADREASPPLASLTLPALRVDAIFVFSDPRDWALDIQIIIDLLLSHQGYLGTISSSNGNESLSNRGYQADGQPPIYFSNPDLWWSAAYPIPRLGQGGFREALEGVWRAITGGEEKGVRLRKHMFGKPNDNTYQFAEDLLEKHRQDVLGKAALPPLRRVYMVGDNPASDIRGANEYRSRDGSEWYAILVRTGVYNGGQPSAVPKAVVKDVWDAVGWGLRESKWRYMLQME